MLKLVVLVACFYVVLTSPGMTHHGEHRNTTEVNTTDVNATEDNTTDVNRTDVDATDVNATEINAMEVNTTDVNATDVKHKQDKHTSVNLTDVKHKHDKHTAAYTTDVKQTTVNTTENEQQCVNDFVSWCEAMKYPSENEGESVVSVAYSSGDQYLQVFCYSNYLGVNCTKSSKPWFSCFPNSTLIYNNNTLTMNSTAGADDNVCSTVENISNLILQPTTFNNAMHGYQKPIMEFYKRMMDFQNRMQQPGQRI